MRGSGATPAIRVAPWLASLTQHTNSQDAERYGYRLGSLPTFMAGRAHPADCAGGFSTIRACCVWVHPNATAQNGLSRVVSESVRGFRNRDDRGSRYDATLMWCVVRGAWCVGRGGVLHRAKPRWSRPTVRGGNVVPFDSRPMRPCSRTSAVGCKPCLPLTRKAFVATSRQHPHPSGRVVSVRLPPDIIKRIDALAEHTGRSRDSIFASR